VVSILAVSAGMLFVLSIVAGALMVVESVVVLSELLLADFWELQPAAIEPIIVAIRAELNRCFFIDFVVRYYFSVKYYT